MEAKKKLSPPSQKGTTIANDYFGVAKTLKRRLKECCRETELQEAGNIVYLWACVTAKGLKQGVKGAGHEGKPLPMQQWLNVVDEAASLGANWLVLSLADPLGECEAVWPIGKWAQQVHGMMVGLHLKEGDWLSDKEITLISQLDKKMTRVLIRQPEKEQIRALKGRGITVWSANPQPDGEIPNCQGPTRMIFVNEKGILYTCGLVEGNDTYRMGHVFDSSLKNIISHPDSPRHVHDDIHVIAPGCDGCPALIANFFFHDA